MKRLIGKSSFTGREAILACCFRHSQRVGWVSDAGPTMQHGTWDHFKGGVYSSTQVVINVDTQEPSVVYLSTIFGTWFVRTCQEWNELVQWPDGQWRSRFVRRAVPWLAPEFKVPSPALPLSPAV